MSVTLIRLAGVALVAWSAHQATKISLRDSFNQATDDLKERTMQVSVDTTYTKNGEIADIKRDTTYVVTKADFDKLKP